MRYQVLVGLFISMAYLALSIANKYGYFRINRNIVGKTCRGDRAFTYSDIPMEYGCATKCKNTNGCKSFFYAPDSKICHGCGSTYYKPDQLDGNLNGSVYYEAILDYHVVCPVGYKVDGLHCYKFVYEPKNHQDAEDSCKSINMKLVEPYYDRENNFLKNEVLATYAEDPSIRWWIGVKYFDSYWRFVLTGNLVDNFFTDWRNGTPTGGIGDDKDCVIYYADGRWGKRDCKDNFYYICEKEGSKMYLPA